MPMYTFKHIESGEFFDVMMSMSDKEGFLKDNPHIESCIYSKPLNMHSGIGLGVRKADEGFKDVLRAKKAFYPRSTINVD